MIYVCKTEILKLSRELLFLAFKFTLELESMGSILVSLGLAAGPDSSSIT